MLMEKECPTFGTNLSLITASVSIRRRSRIQAPKAAAVGQVRQIAGQITLTIQKLREIREIRGDGGARSFISIIPSSTLSHYIHAVRTLFCWHSMYHDI